jgi:hypothetical protein
MPPITHRHYVEYHHVLPQLTSACIAGPVIGLSLYGVLRVCGGWRYMPIIFAAVSLLEMGSYCAWIFCFSGE